MPDFNRLRLPLPVRAFVAGCVLTAIVTMAVSESLEMSTRRQVEHDSADIEARINARVAAYESLLRGAAGFFATKTWVERKDFQAYVRQLEVAENYPGVQGVGLTVRLRPEQVPQFEEAARREGWPDFRIWPAIARPEYHSILYLEPDDRRNRAAIGFDMRTEATRRAAMDRARDTGRPSVTGKVVLVQEIEGAKQAGFLMYVPFYAADRRPETAEERQELLAGYAYAAFRAGDFLKTLLEPGGLSYLAMSVYDGTQVDPAALVYTTESEDVHRRARRVSKTRTFRVLERPWTLVYSMSPQGVVSPLTIALLGLVASTGVALLFGRVERARRRAERSEAATREREGELALLVDAVPALVTYVDKNGVVRLGNRRFGEWFGGDVRKLAGRSLQELTSIDLYKDIQNHFGKAMAGEGVSFERWYKVGSAGARYLHTLYVPNRGEGGAVNGVYALTSDLTAHKRAEEAARFVADCGKLLITSMDFDTTSRGIVHLAVPRIADVAALFRATDNELQGILAAHVDPSAEQQLNAFIEKLRFSLGTPNKVGMAARTGTVMVTSNLTLPDLDNVGQDDAQRAMLRLVGLRSALHVPVVVRGRIWGVFSFGTTVASGRQFTDEHRQLGEEISARVRLAVENSLLYREAQQEIDVRRRAERVAREAEERFRLLVAGVRDYAIITLDLNGRIESWNEGAQHILGYAAAEVVGHAPDEFYTADDRRDEAAQRQLGAARDRGASSDERWFLRKDGSRFWASSHTVALREEGAVRGYAWILRDLTDRKRMEEELERRVQIRTTELNEAVHELEAFSYSVSHDLRAPLRTIRGFTELALEEAGDRLNEEERGYLDRVRRASARLERLISDLLAYTRISKTKIELRPIDLHALVSDIQREHPEFQPPRAEVGIEEGLLPAMGNEAYLTQCVTNLLGNAVKFVPEGVKPVVRIWTERHGGMVRLYVKDNGIGIPPERLSRAFEMFERLHTTGSYEGTGVGLAIVRRAVQRMKGSVGVTSKVGEGTTFWIELPAA